MQLNRSLATVLLTTALLPAVAESHYCIGGDLDHLTSAEINSCKASMAEVREVVRGRGAPSGWRFLLVCDDASWQDVAALTGQAEGVLRNANYQTDRAAGITFLRRSRMSAEEGGPARLLNAALDGLPGRPGVPGTDAAPAPIPNVERKREVPALLIATEHVPEVHHEDEAVAGQ